MERAPFVVHKIERNHHRTIPHEPAQNSHDAYFAVLLLSGVYTLEQNGRKIILQPGDLTLYDATMPHRIFCPESFAKLIVSIPRPMLRERVPSVEHCTALRIPGHEGIGAITGDFIRSCAGHAGELSLRDFSALSEQCCGFLSLALASVRPAAVPLASNRSILLLSPTSPTGSDFCDFRGVRS